MMNMISASKIGEWFRAWYNDAFNKDLSDVVKNALEPETVNFLGIQVNPSLFTALGVTAFILVAAVLIRIFVIPKFKKEPKGFQILLEGLVSFFDGTAGDTGRFSPFVGAYIYTAGLFIALGTLVELLGIRPAFADINTCFAFGLATFVIINVCAVRQKGPLGRLKRYLNPINLVTDLAVPISLSFRLFGAIMSGFIIMDLVYSFIFTSFAVPAVVSVITTLFHALIQSYLFGTLTTLFVSEGME